LAKSLHNIRLLASLTAILLRGSAAFVAASARRVFRKIFKPSTALPRVELMVSTYEIMRERLMNSLNEIEQKNLTLEESREKLKNTGEFLKAVIDSVDLGVMVLDEDLKVLQANQYLRQMHYGREIIGKRCYEVAHLASQPCTSPDAACPLYEVKSSGRTVQVIQVHADDRDNGGPAPRYLEVSLSPLYGRKGEIVQFVELVRDITESKMLENRILEANRRLLVLNAISAAASQSLSLDVILNETLDKALELLGAEIGCIALYEQKAEEPSFQAQRNLPEGTDARDYCFQFASQVLQSGQAAVANLPGAALPDDVKIFACAPLKVKDRVVGVLTIASRKMQQISQQELQLLASIGNQLGIIVENAQLYRECRLNEDSKTELLRRIIMAQEDERHRVARELHDVTSQTLATLAVGLEGLANAAHSTESERAVRLEKMRVLLADTSKEIHRLIYDLRPSQLDDLGLSVALRSCAHNSLDQAGVEVHMEVAGQERRLAPELEIALFRIAQEAIANISRHAQAESVYINLEFREDSVAIQLEDDGIGFDFSQGFGGRSGGGVGLLGMKERAELIGGRLTIDTSLNSGTRIAVEIPTAR
jgi:PAS domain S-box-containing protein